MQNGLRLPPVTLNFDLQKRLMPSDQKRDADDPAHRSIRISLGIEKSIPLAIIPR